MHILTDDSLELWGMMYGGIKPFDRELINPASVDLRFEGRWFDIHHVNRKYYERIGAVTLYPSTTVNRILRRPTIILASTLETVKFPNHFAGMIKLKTTPTREGLGHPIADWIDPGFEGQLTLMLHAFKRITIIPGQRIVQLVVIDLGSPCKKDYEKSGGHYMNQVGPTPSWRDLRVKSNE